MKIKQNNGVTLIILAVTITVMLILLGTMASRLKGTKDVREYANMQADIIRINEKINTYYAQNGILPVRNKYNDVQMLKHIKNPNDNENYYVVDLSKIELNELELGIKGFLNVRKINIDISIEKSHGIRDVYIINEQSHTVYYPQGVTVGDATEYSLTETYIKQEDVAYVPENIEDAKNVGKEFTDSKTTLQDSKGNKVVIPGGFKVAKDSGNTVQQGIVIEDVSASDDNNVKGSQFVWIPVGTFVKDDGTTSKEIVLGRYIFDKTNGTPTLVQAAYTKENPENYMNKIELDYEGNKYIELPDYQMGILDNSNHANDLNATAHSLKGFVDSSRTNGGYYIARYEASYASGSSINDYKAASKISIYNSESSMNYKAGTLWGNITQIEASKVSINTYNKSIIVKSDLMNSYAWDTAIVYIQEAGHANYANQGSRNTQLVNTGENRDEVCKINDMASNAGEWSTEHAMYVGGPCCSRGSFCKCSNCFTEQRRIGEVTYNRYDGGFRFIIYIL